MLLIIFYDLESFNPIFSELLHAVVHVFGRISSVAFPGRFVSSLADCTRSIFILLSGTIFTLLGLFWPSVIVSLWTLLGKFYSFSGPVFTGPFRS